MFMRPFLQEPANAVAPEELLPVPLPLFLSYSALTEHGHSEDTGKVMVYHYKTHRAGKTLLPYGKIELLIHIIMRSYIDE